MFMDRIIPRGGPILFILMVPRFMLMALTTKSVENQTRKPLKAKPSNNKKPCEYLTS